MRGFEQSGILEQVILRLKQIRTRTWLILGSVALAVIGLLVWAAISLLSWLWTQGGTVGELGKRVAGDALTQVEQVAPGLREQAEQWLPVDVREQADKWLPAEVKAQADKWLPAEVKEQASKWLPQENAELPANDVSGNDVGPVSRFPGMVRSHFAREGQTVEVRYAGSATFAAVLAHYVEGFVAAGYTQEVMSASADGEQHRFSNGEESIDLSLLRQRSGQVEVGLKLSSP